MECLNDIYCGKYSLVGIRDFVHCAHPENILFVNDIPGINLKQASAIVSDEHRTGIKLMQDKIIVATKKVFHKFSGIVSNQFDFNAIIESREINHFNTTQIPAAALERGLYLKRWKSDSAKIFIQELYIKVANSGIAIIKIKDGEETVAIQASLLANVTNVVKVEYKCKNREVFVTFDQTNFATYGCSLNDETGCTSCGTHRKMNHNLIVKGWDGSAEQYGCYGMGILTSVQCYEENILCQALPRMAFMIYYQSGIEILNEHLASGRINAVVLFTKEQAAETLKELKISLKEEERQFAKNINSFLKSTRGECFTCNGSRVTYGLP